MIKWRLMSGCSTEPYNNKHDTGCSRVPAGLAVPSTTTPLHRDFKRGRHDSSLSDGFWPARQKTPSHPRLWPGLSANCASSGRDIPFTWDPEDTSAHQLLAAPKDILQVWCVPAIPVFNTNISLQRRNLSLCLGPSCFPWGTQPSTGPSPCSARKDKARQGKPSQAMPTQLVQGLIPEHPHEAAWQQLPCNWCHQPWWDRPGLSKKSHLRM